MSKQNFFFSLVVFTTLFIQTNELTAQNNKLIVGTKETAPFSLKNSEDQWTGISIELWQNIAKELEMDFVLKEMDLDSLLNSVKNGSLNAAVAAFTITSKREDFLDFSHPYYMTGLSIAIDNDKKSKLFNHIKRIFSIDLLKVVFLLALLLFCVGIVVWLFERKRNPDHFGGSKLNGIGSGFWWSAVTMTTVGYGDKAPSTIGGRLVGLIWMFAGIIMISSFTAAITSELTVSQLETTINGPEDLPNIRVGTVQDSTSEAYLKKKQISFTTFKTATKCLEAVEKGYIDAMVYDEAILRYLANTTLKGKVRVIPNTFEKQYYGIVLQQNSPLREAVNKSLLHQINTPEWNNILYKYLGN